MIMGSMGPQGVLKVSYIIYLFINQKQLINKQLDHITKLLNIIELYLNEKYEIIQKLNTWNERRFGDLF